LLSITQIFSMLERKILDMYQTLLLAKKTSKDDYSTHMRFILLGMGVIGALGFVIKFIGELLTSAPK
jgi:protein transport protein SEC61 subunit gamma and related proteins